MKEIPLSKEGKNRGKYVALVDDEDFERVNQFRWVADVNKNTVYAKRTNCVNGIKHGKTLMHNFITKFKKTDHADRNGLNNQGFNLRECTDSQNMMNRGPFKNKSSTYKGVSFNKRYQKWSAEIVLNKKRTFLGYFIDEVVAAKIYNKKAKELFGEFAFLNEFQNKDK